MYYPKRNYRGGSGQTLNPKSRERGIFARGAESVGGRAVAWA